MRSLVSINEKGGVGKTFFIVQFAFYCAYFFNLKVAVIDLDNQRNASEIISKSGLSRLANVDSLMLLNNDFDKWDIVDHPNGALENYSENFPVSNIVLFSAPLQGMNLLQAVEHEENKLANIVFSFKEAIDKLSASFDLVLIDTNPSPDVRSNAALAACTHVVSPIQCLPESIRGISGLYERIQDLSQVNDCLKSVNHGFLGILPSLVESNSYQVENLQDILEQASHLLIPVKEIESVCQNGQLCLNRVDNFAVIKKRTAYAVAQGSNKPVWRVANSDLAWRELKRPFFSILEMLDIDREDTSTKEMKLALAQQKEIYKEYWAELLRQFWLSNNSEFVNKLDYKLIEPLSDLKRHVPLSILKSNV